MRRLLRYLVVAVLERGCEVLDWIPRYDISERRWERYGDWGCLHHMARLSAELEERWNTGYWKPVDPSESWLHQHHADGGAK